MGSRGQSMQKERRRAEARAVRQLVKILGGGGAETRAARQDADKKVIPIAPERTANTESNFSDSFFKDESSKTIFYLLHMSGKARTDALGISEDLYENAQNARNWYVRMSKLVHPDNTDNPEAGAAFGEIRRIYKRMKQLSTDQGQAETAAPSKTSEKTTAKTATAAKTESSYADAFFKDESSKTIFYLLHMGGKERTDFLGINEKLYGNSTEARKWYTKMSKLVHPDNTDNPEAAQAFKEIKRIYGRMKK